MRKDRCCHPVVKLFFMLLLLGQIDLVSAQPHSDSSVFYNSLPRDLRDSLSFFRKTNELSVWLYTAGMYASVDPAKRTRFLDQARAAVWRTPSTDPEKQEW